MIYKDHTGLPFALKHLPTRIVCLVPSITELLFDLGLGPNVIGITKFCVYPENGFPNAAIIGGTKNINLDKIKKLKPDLVIANKEENVKEQVLAIAAFTNIFTTVVGDTDEALKMILDLGVITGTQKVSERLVQEFKNKKLVPSAEKQLSMAYLIWRKPYMTIGGDTFISSFMGDFGFNNCFKAENRYPVISLQDIIDKKPDIILLSSEPFPFADVHASEIYQQTGIKTQLIDGSICSWYGSRMLKAQDFFRTYKQQILSELSLNGE